MMKLTSAIMTMLRVLLVLTKLILVPLRQFPTFLMTKTEVNSVYNLLNIIHNYS